MGTLAIVVLILGLPTGLAGFCGGIAWFYRRGRKLDRFLESSQMVVSSLSDPGVLETLHTIGEQFKNNGGSSLRDAVDRIERYSSRAADLNGRLEALDTRIAALNTYVRDFKHHVDQVETKTDLQGVTLTKQIVELQATLREITDLRALISSLAPAPPPGSTPEEPDSVA